MNNEPEVALRVLEFCTRSVPSLARNAALVKLHCRILRRQGDMRALSSLLSATLQPSISGDSVIRSGNDTVDFTLKEMADLWNEFYLTEAALGLTSLVRLEDLRVRRNKAILDYEESFRSSRSQLTASCESFKDIGNCVSSILDRFTLLDAAVLGGLDGGVSHRSDRILDREGRSGGIGWRGDERKEERQQENGRREEESRKRGRKDEVFDEFSPATREFLRRLPTQRFAGVDIYSYINHIQRLSLPPRPFLAEVSVPRDQRLSKEGGVYGVDEEADAIDSTNYENIFNQRQRDRLIRY